MFAGRSAFFVKARLTSSSLNKSHDDEQELILPDGSICGFEYSQDELQKSSGVQLSVYKLQNNAKAYFIKKLRLKTSNRYDLRNFKPNAVPGSKLIICCDLSGGSTLLLPEKLECYVVEQKASNVTIQNKYTLVRQSDDGMGFTIVNRNPQPPTHLLHFTDQPPLKQPAPQLSIRPFVSTSLPDKDRLHFEWMSAFRARLKEYIEHCAPLVTARLESKGERLVNPTHALPKPHQLTAMRAYLKKLERDLDKGPCHAVFPLPTGAGKTALFSWLIKQFMDTEKTVKAHEEELKKERESTLIPLGKKDLELRKKIFHEAFSKQSSQSLSKAQNITSPKVMIVVPTLILLEQTKERFKKFVPDLTCFAELGSTKVEIKERLETNDVVIVTYQSLQRHYAEVPWEQIGMVCLDEAHNSLSENRSEMVRYIKNKDCTVLAFTATPVLNLKEALSSKNSKGLASVYELLGYQKDGSDNPIPVLEVSEAIKQGINCPVAYTIVSPKNENKEAVEIFSKTTRPDSTVEIDSRSVAKVINQPCYNLIAIDIYLNGISKFTGVPFRGKKGLVFCAGIKHAQEVAETFNRCIPISNIDPEGELEKKYKKNVYNHFNKDAKKAEEFLAAHPFCVAQAVHSVVVKEALESLDKEECRQRILQHKLNGAPILTGADILQEGFDDVEIEVIINLRPTHSHNNQIQRCGRGLRLDENNKNKICHIFDFQWGSTPHCLFLKFLKNKFVIGINNIQKQSIPSFEKIKLQGAAPYELIEDSENTSLYLKNKNKKRRQQSSSSELSLPQAKQKRQKPDDAKNKKKVTLNSIEQLVKELHNEFQHFNKMVKHFIRTDEAIEETNNVEMMDGTSRHTEEKRAAKKTSSFNVTSETQQKITEWKDILDEHKAFFNLFEDVSESAHKMNIVSLSHLSPVNVLGRLHHQYVALIKKIGHLTVQSLISQNELIELKKEVQVIHNHLEQNKDSIHAVVRHKRQQTQSLSLNPSANLLTAQATAIQDEKKQESNDHSMGIIQGESGALFNPLDPPVTLMHSISSSLQESTVSDKKETDFFPLSLQEAIRSIRPDNIQTVVNHIKSLLELPQGTKMGDFDSNQFDINEKDIDRQTLLDHLIGFMVRVANTANQDDLSALSDLLNYLVKKYQETIEPLHPVTHDCLDRFSSLVFERFSLEARFQQYVIGDDKRAGDAHLIAEAREEEVEMKVPDSGFPFASSTSMNVDLSDASSTANRTFPIQCSSFPHQGSASVSRQSNTFFYQSSAANSSVIDLTFEEDLNPASTLSK